MRSRSSLAWVVLLYGTVLFFGSAAALAGDVKLAWDANTESILAGYKVYYGTASRVYGPPIDVGNVTTYTVTGLAPGTYYFAVTAYSTTGFETTYSNEVSATVAGSDTTAPTISAVASSGITGSGATITWTTNELSDTQVEFGTSTSYGSLSPLNSSMVTAHSMTLTGLLPGTLYHYRARSKDAAANLGLSGDYTFTTSASCTYAISPLSQSGSAPGWSGTVSVSAPAGCGWTAGSGAAWITVTGGGSGSGNGTVAYAVAPNTTISARTGSLTIAGQAFQVSQAKTGCDINSDSAVNVVDVQMLVNIILGTAMCPGNCDVNGNGIVDVVDLQVLANVLLGVSSCP